MKNKILIGSIVVTLVIILWVGFARADVTTTIDASTYQLLKTYEAQQQQDIINQNNIIASDQNGITTAQSLITQDNTALNAEIPLTDAYEHAQYVATLAVTGANCTQNSDCQSGVCSGSPGVNWTVGVCQ